MIQLQIQTRDGAAEALLEAGFEGVDMVDYMLQRYQLQDDGLNSGKDRFLIPR